MLYDASGRTIDPEPKAKMIEDTASFGYDLDVKKADGTSAYEKAKFFRSHKFRCREEDKEEASREAWDWCVEEVMQDIRLFNERRARKQAQKAERNAA